MAGALAVLCDGFQSLSNQVHITLIYIKAQQPQSSGGAATDTVQELKSLAHQIVVCLVVLVAQKVLDSEQKKRKRKQSVVGLQVQVLTLNHKTVGPVPAGLSCGSHRAAAGNVGSVS